MRFESEQAVLHYLQMLFRFWHKKFKDLFGNLALRLEIWNEYFPWMRCRPCNCRARSQLLAFGMLDLRDRSHFRISGNGGSRSRERKRIFRFEGGDVLNR